MQIKLDTNMNLPNYIKYCLNDLKNIIIRLRHITYFPSVEITPIGEYGEVKLLIRGVTKKDLNRVWYADELYSAMFDSEEGAYILLSPDSSIEDKPYINIQEEDFDANTVTKKGYVLDINPDTTVTFTETLEQTEYGVVVQNR